MTRADAGSGAIVAIDQGKSATRSIAYAAVGHAILAEAVSGGFDYGSTREVDDELVESLLRAVNALGLPASPAVIGIVSTGVAEARAVTGACGHAIAFRTGASRVLLAEDVVGAHLGALGGGPGVVVSAGTGSIALWTDGVSSRRIDGFGPLLGDDGSAYDIGSRGLRAAFAAVDGRGPATLLTHRARKHLGGLGLDTARRVHARADAVAVLGDFAPAVSAAADDCDAVASRILDDAGCALARTARVAVGSSTQRRGPVRLSYTGQVFQSSRVLASFRAESTRSGLQLIAPLGDNLTGALAMAREPGSHAFAALIADTDDR